MLRLGLLGPPVVECDGVPVAFDTRKSIALLAVLAVRRRPQSRDTLAAMLWPEADVTRARSSLRRTLSVTTSAVGPALSVTRSIVDLDAAQVWCDVWEFERLAATGDVASLTAATTLYRDTFLSGFHARAGAEFDHWQELVTEEHRQRLSKTLEQLVDVEAATGDLDAAQAHARRWLALDELHEPAHRALMRVLAWSDKRSASLDQYRRCVRIMDEELGVAPLDETTALYEEIRADRLEGPHREDPFPIRGAQRVVDDRSQPTSGPAPAALPCQKALIDALTADVGRVGTDGHGGRVAVITGPAGSGKSWIVEVLRKGVGEGVVWVAARCHEGEHLLEFGCATELLRATFAARSDVRERIGESDVREIARLVPGLVGCREPMAPLESPGAQVRFFRAVVSALGSVADTAVPAVIVVEDLGHIDESSSRLLAYLVRRLDELRVLVVLTSEAQQDTPHMLAAALAGAERDGRLSRFDAPRLDRSDVEAVLAARGVLGVDPSAFFERTGGLALLVVAYADSYAAAEATITASSDGVVARTAVPTGARELFADRLAGVTETTGQVLSAASVLGTSFDAALLRATSGRSAAEVADALDEALARGLVMEHGSQERGDAYEFSYDGLRRVAYDSCGPARRRLLHGRAADALARRAETTTSGSLFATVALHMAMAGRDGQAARWSWRAGERSIALFAHAEAIEHLRQALAHGHPAAQTHAAIADALVALGRYREARLELESAAASVDPSDTVSSVTIEHRLASVHERLGNWPVASAHIEAALELARDHHDLKARIEADRAYVALQRGEPRARELASTALDDAKESSDAQALAQAYNVAGMLASLAGDLVSAEDLLRSSLEVGTAAEGEPAASVAALNNLAKVLHDAGRADEAIEVAEEALRHGLECGDVHRVAALHSNLADLLHAAGRADDSMDHLKRAAAGFASVDAGDDVTPGVWTLTRW